MNDSAKKRIGVLTSGGDAPGMNAAVRAVVRIALDQGHEAYAIFEGYQGLIDGGDRIRPLGWNDVGGILHLGGTIIGSARCADFRTREGRLKAVINPVVHQIEALVVIGGDGSLSGADVLYDEWPALLAELVERGTFNKTIADRFPQLAVAGLPGSIDNDLCCTDMTSGAPGRRRRQPGSGDRCRPETAVNRRRRHG
jgi:6-phosphofructokinase 1